MLERPWHERHPTHEHYRIFTDLADLHTLTLSCLKTLGLPQQMPHKLKRVVGPEQNDDFWMIENLAENALPSQLDQMLDETEPEELLSRLKNTVWSMQAWSIRGVLEKTPEKEFPALKNLLEQVAWKAGRQCAQKRWPKLMRQAQNDLSAVFTCLYHSPFSGYPHRSAFLVRKSSPQELEIELLQCPHEHRFPEIKPVADFLCSLHVHWMRGFAYALNSRTMITYIPRDPRCILRFYFHNITS